MSVDNITPVKDLTSPGAYLREGLYWPPQEDPETGDFRRARAEESIASCLRNIVLTAIGELPVLATMGTRFEDLLFAVASPGLVQSVAVSIEEGVRTHEKRVEFINIDAKQRLNDVGTATVELTLRYKILTLQKIETLVLPLDPQSFSEAA